MNELFKESIVMIALFVLFCLGCLVGASMGQRITTEAFEKKAIAAGVGYYNPTNKEFMFRTNNFQEINR